MNFPAFDEIEQRSYPFSVYDYVAVGRWIVDESKVATEEH
jgi:predicted RNA-binding protein